MRHLYAASSEPGVSYLIDKAKTYERRRCGHLPEDYPEPLSARDCIKAVVDGKNNGTNKHRYVVASQDIEVRKAMRAIQGVPLVYINRSVMIMEPMAETSTETRDREKKGRNSDKALSQEELQEASREREPKAMRTMTKNQQRKIWVYQKALRERRKMHQDQKDPIH